MISTDTPNIIFLHIPKTAGQSVHALLVDLFDAAAISPSRVNEQLFQMSIADIRKYRVFSGHLDWALLDCLQGPRFAFTILRDPVDRVLSFYFFLRKSASALKPEQLRLPQNQGMRAALELSCDDYFCAGEPGLRTFLDNHYENFYAHFLAGRTYEGRQHLVGRKRADPAFTDEKIVAMALENLATLEGVYAIDRLDLLEADLRRFAGAPGAKSSLTSLRVNQGDGGTVLSRMERLRALGATAKTFDRLRKMTVLDQDIWQHVREAQAARP